MKHLQKITESLITSYYYKCETINNKEMLEKVKPEFVSILKLLSKSVFKEYVWYNSSNIYVYKHSKDDVKNYIMDNGLSILECGVNTKCSQKMVFKVNTGDSLIPFLETGGKKKVVSLDENGNLTSKNSSVTNFTHLYEEIILLKLEENAKNTEISQLKQDVDKFKSLKGEVVFGYLVDFINKIQGYLDNTGVNFSNYTFQLFDGSNLLYKKYRKLGGNYKKDNWNPGDLILINNDIISKLSSFNDMTSFIKYVNENVNSFNIIPISLKFNTVVSTKDKKFKAGLVDMSSELSSFDSEYKVTKLDLYDMNRYYTTSYIANDKIVKNVEYRYEILKYGEPEVLKLRLGNRSDSTHNASLISFESAPIYGLYKLGSINKEKLNDMFNLKGVLNTISTINLENMNNYLAFMNKYTITDYIFNEEDYNKIVGFDEKEIRYFMGLHAYVCLFHKGLKNNPKEIIKSVFKIGTENSNYIKAEYV